MRKLFMILIIMAIAAFIYYSRQGFFFKREMRKDLENKIEESTGLDLKLRDTLRNLENIEENIRENEKLREAVNNLSESAREELKKLDKKDMKKLLEEAKDKGVDLKNFLEEELD